MNTNKFIVKLLRMINQFPQVINWTTDGLQIQIFDVEKFSTQVHPKYFTTSNYKSFLRQLNMYNFKKMSKCRNSVSFRHSQFRRGNQTQFQNIKRKKQRLASFASEENQPEKSSTLEERPIQSQPLMPSHLSFQIRQTILLLKNEVSYNGLLLIRQLEELLQRDNRVSASSSNLGCSQPINFREYISFGKIQENVPENTSVITESNEYNFQSQIFEAGEYFEQ